MMVNLLQKKIAFAVFLMVIFLNLATAGSDNNKTKIDQDNIGNQIPVLELRVREDRLSRIEEAVQNQLPTGILTASSKTWHDAKLLAPNLILRVKIAARGFEIGSGSYKHWKTAKHPSFNIRVRGGKTFLGVKRFNLQPLSTKPFNFLVQSVASKAGLITPRYRIINLKLNNRHLGKYYLEEAPGPLMLEARNKPNGPILGFDEFDQIRAQKSANHNKLNKYHTNVSFKDVSIKLLGGNIYSPQSALAINALYKAQLGIGSPLKHFDVHETAKVFVFLNLFAGEHSHDVVNVKFYFDPIKQKLIPMIIDEDLGSPAHLILSENKPLFVPFPYKNLLSCGRFISAIKSEMNIYLNEDFRNSLYQSIIETLDNSLPSFRKNAVGGMLPDRPSFNKRLTTRIQILSDFIDEVHKAQKSCSEPIEPQFHPQMSKYEPFAFPSQDDSYHKPGSINPTIIQHFSAYITGVAKKKALDLGTKVIATLDELDLSKGEARFRIRSVTNDPVTIVSIEVGKRTWPVNKVITTNSFVTDPSKHLQRKSDLVSFAIHSPSVFYWGADLPKSMNLNIIHNGITYTQPVFATGNILDLDDPLYVGATSNANVSSLPSGVKLINGIWVIGPGKVELYRSISFAQGDPVQFLPNTELVLFDGAKVHTSGNVEMIADSPRNRISVKIHPKIINGVPVSFGGLTLNGASSDKHQVVMHNVTFTGQGAVNYTPTKERSDYFGTKGCISLNRLSVEVDNVAIENMHCEDAINIVNSELFGRNLDVNGSLADALDADFSSVTLSESQFQNNANDALDFSFSNVKLKRIEVNVAGDKAISVGESSRLDGQYISVNQTLAGLAVKDGAKAVIKGLSVIESQIGVAQYVKKNYFSPPELTCVKCSLEESLIADFIIAVDTEAKINSEIIVGNVSRHDVVNLGLMEK